eukprot:SAG31_NODE_2519_length_5569_cov_4.141316_2_plen_288_part_00
MICVHMAEQKWNMQAIIERAFMLCPIECAAVLKAFVDSITMAKFVVCPDAGTEHLLEVIDADQLPREYGGTSDFVIPGRVAYHGFPLGHLVGHLAPCLLASNRAELTHFKMRSATAAGDSKPGGELTVPLLNNGEGLDFTVKANTVFSVPTVCCDGNELRWQISVRIIDRNIATTSMICLASHCLILRALVVCFVEWQASNTIAMRICFFELPGGIMHRDIANPFCGAHGEFIAGGRQPTVVVASATECDEHKGQWTATSSGVLVVELDNTGSRFRSRTVKLAVFME